MSRLPLIWNICVFFCLILDHFWESQLKGDPNLRGHPEKFNIEFFAQIFWESQYMSGSQEKVLEPKQKE